MSPSSTPSLQINHPTPGRPSSTERRPPRLESSYFSSRPHTKERVSSPIDQAPSAPGVTLSPRSLLNTPPILEASSPKQESGYFNQRPLPRHIGTATVSDTLSTASWISGSFHSSDIGRSLQSNSSSEYLEPPHFQVDDDNPPYKPRKRSDQSLSMIRKPRRANTMPSSKKRKKRQHKKRDKKNVMEEHQNRSSWWVPRYQTVPTAPPGQKELCRDDARPRARRKFNNGKANTSENHQSDMRESFERPAVTRRWSSVEVSAHQVLLESTLPVRESRPQLLPTSQNDDMFAPNIQVQRYRSSSFTRGAIDLDILRTVREKLTHRKVPSTHLDTPVSITLRRASQRTFQPEHTNQSQISDWKNALDRYSPILSMFGELHQRRQSAAYIITSQDIDNITELIETNLKLKFQDNYRSETRSRSSTAYSGRTSRSQSVSGQCCQAKISPQDGLGSSTAEVSAGSDIRSKGFLQVNKASQRKKSSQRKASTKSFHEVIWEGGKNSSVLSGDEDDESSPISDSGAQYFSADDFFALPFPIDKGNAFDPNNARASISEWSGRLPQNEISLIVTSSDSEPNNSSHLDTGRYIDGLVLPSRPTMISSVSYPVEGNSIRSSARSSTSNARGRTSPKIKPFTRYTSTETKVQDVVSFPPLAPRKTTNDWFSPLPEMEIAPHLSTSRSLHDLGLDASFGPNSSNTATPKASQAFRVEQTPPISHARSLDFNNFRRNVFDTSKPPAAQEVRRKSIVKPHPKAPPRIGESSAVGSSIGCSTGERRRSSTAPRAQRVRTIDNIHKGERDQPCTKWRKPSACPPPKSPSPGEDSDSREQWILGPEAGVQRLSRLRSGLLNRTGVLAMKCPPIPKVDCTRIYGSITGARRAGSPRGRSSEDERACCNPHVCDDNEMDPRRPSVDWIG